ncbi:FG-GAP-like repeat-containing protein [Bradyrhizobium sp. RT3a]|uniref:FG-GAP-like repeat-containing protein n=1 Tax=unclassified Bradyrhizobium TaxID=2631580 RepID=UPI003394EDBF
MSGIIGLTATTAALTPGVAYTISSLFSFVPLTNTVAEVIGFDPSNTILAGSTPGLTISGTTPDANGLDRFYVFGPHTYYGSYPDWSAGTLAFPPSNSGTDNVTIFIQWVQPQPGNTLTPFLYAGTTYTFSFTVSSLVIAPSNKFETAAVPIQFSQVTGGAVATDTTGQIHFTDTDTSARPTAAISSSPVIIVKNYAGDDVTSKLDASQLAILQTAFTISPEAGNTNNGIIDWKFSYHGAYYDLDFLAGKHVTVENTIAVSDQNGQSDTATVTNTIDLPQYAGIDYRHTSTTDPLVPADIKAAGINMVGEYLGGGSSYLTKAEAKAITAAGLSIFSIYEHAGMDGAAYYASSVAYGHGVTDATNAIKNAIKVGEPSGSAIYFGIDLDPAALDGDLNGVVAYFGGVNAVFAQQSTAHYQVGVYGGGDVLQMIKEGANLATYSFLAESTGWSGSKTYTGWNIEQVRDPSLTGSTDFPSTHDFSQVSYIAGDLTQGSTGAWNSTSSFPAIAHNDLNGDGRDDVFWQNDNGATVAWLMNGSTVMSGAGLQAPHIAAANLNIGDFNGDGVTDALARAPDGSLSEWVMADDGQFSFAQSISATPDTSWKIAGAGDFNGDGITDLLWRNTTGTLTDWQMDGSKIAAASNLAAQPDPTWKVQSVADFNGDGNSDILWRSTTGTVNIWTMNGANLSGNNISVQPDLTWHVAGTGDFDGNGTADILWHNNNGQTVIWSMNGTQLVSGQAIGSVPAPSWHIAQVSDFNGDGHADILWQNTNGALTEWDMNGAQIISAQDIGARPDSTWHIVANHYDVV